MLNRGAVALRPLVSPRYSSVTTPQTRVPNRSRTRVLLKRVEVPPLCPLPLDPSPKDDIDHAHHHPYNDDSVTFTDQAGQVVTLERNKGWFKCLRCNQNTSRSTVRAKSHHNDKCPLRPNADPQPAVPAAPEPQPPANTATPEPQPPPPVAGPMNDPPVPVVVAPPATDQPFDLRSLPKLPPLDIYNPVLPPGEGTVNEFDGIDLMKYGFTVNTHLRMAVCFQCNKVIFPSSKICQHVASHLGPVLSLSEDFTSRLIEEFDLRSEPEFPNHPIPPVYGIPLELDALTFCGTCFRGYNRDAALKTHRYTESHKQDNPVRLYAQGIQTTSIRYIALDFQLVDGHPVFPQATLDFELSFRRSIDPVRAAFNLPISQPQDHGTLNHFFTTEGWIPLIEGHHPAAVEDARRSHLKQPLATAQGYLLDRAGPQFFQLAVGYIGGAQPHIQENVSFGVDGYLGQTIPDSDMTYNFRKLTPPSVLAYAGSLHGLIFNSMRFYVPEADAWTSTFQYPPVPVVFRDAFRALFDAVVNPAPHKNAAECYAECVRLLLCHHKSEYPETQSNPRFFSPVCSFVILHTIDAQGKQLKAGSITQVIAHLMYATRAAVLLQAVRAHAADPAVTVLDHTKTLSRFIRDHQDTPFAFLFNSVKVLKIMRDADSNLSDFEWTSDLFDELTYRGNLVTFKGIQDSINSQVVAYIQLLSINLFYSEAIPEDMSWTSPVSDLVDDLSSTMTKYSFVDDPRNGFAQYKFKYGTWLLSDPGRREYFLVPHPTKLIWKPKSLLKWLEGYEVIQMALAVLLILSAGPSPRATEFCRFLLRERLGCRRNATIGFKNVSLDSTGDKTSVRHRLQLRVPHIATLEVQRLLLQNLACFRQVAEYFVEQIFPPDHPAVDAYLYNLWPSIYSPHGHLDSSKLSEALADATQRGTGQRFGIRAWRSLTTVIFRQRADPDTRAHHAHADTFYDRANMHSTATADRFYGGSTGFSQGTSGSTLLGFARVSAQWHKIMNIGQDEPILPVRSAPPPTEGSLSVSASDLQQLPFVTRAEFASLKDEMLEALKDTNLLGVLSTSIGKTTLILMLARVYAPDKTTIVVLPLSALHEDFKRRANQFGVHPARYSSKEEFNRNANVVTVAVEALEHPQFYRYLESLAAQNRLFRIFFDEVHTVLTDVHYRSVFAETHKLNIHGVQLVGLTATLPPTLVRPFSETVKSSFKLLRTPTARPEQKITKEGFATDALALDALLESVGRTVPDYQEGERGLIFCQTRKDAELVAKELRVLPFHAGTDSEGLDAFISGKQLVLPCTSVLSAGIDLRGVRNVWLLKPPPNLILFIQEIGRGGRDGEVVVVILYYTDPPRFHATEGPFDLGSDVMRRWVTDDTLCLRHIISEYLDGQPVTCLLLERAQLCSFCQRQMEQPAPRSAERLVPRAKAVATPVHPPPTPTPSSSHVPPLSAPSTAHSDSSATAISHFGNPSSSPTVPLLTSSAPARLAPSGSLSSFPSPSSFPFSSSFPSASRLDSPPTSSPSGSRTGKLDYDMLPHNSLIAQRDWDAAFQSRPRPKPAARQAPSFGALKASNAVVNHLDEERNHWNEHVNVPLEAAMNGFLRRCLYCSSNGLSDAHSLADCNARTTFTLPSHCL
ncbi:hypothetical protein EIP91_010708 [Steccherinum ochraceum]|uniref:DNA 3'-5' helicase n=1 Tax=Steccherinum ochraceum TaxID=92696 RepID=A0A4R0R0A6_9APHY|nr:hypothetical protein EIP91_010708 [Steccherinum ochraceum]